MSYIAFSDIDETIIKIKSMYSFAEYCRKHSCVKEMVSRNKKILDEIFYYSNTMANKCPSREEMNKNFYQIFKGIDVDTLSAIGCEWWDKVKKDPHVFRWDVIGELEKHRFNGAKIVLVSGSALPIVKPIASWLNASSAILTNLEVNNGKYTGKIVNAPNIGEEKRQAILRYISNQKDSVSLKSCFAYGDHISDIYMLEAVGNPVVVANDALLVDKAIERNWKIIN